MWASFLSSNTVIAGRVVVVIDINHTVVGSDILTAAASRRNGNVPSIIAVVASIRVTDAAVECRTVLGVAGEPDRANPGIPVALPSGGIGVVAVANAAAGAVSAGEEVEGAIGVDRQRRGDEGDEAQKGELGEQHGCSWGGFERYFWNDGGMIETG